MRINSCLKICVAALLSGFATFNSYGYELTDWQSELPDAAYVSTLSLPGAHDAATGEGFTSSTMARTAQTQTLKLQELYNAGVRVIDFRPGVKSSGLITKTYNLQCYHGSAEIKKDFGEAIKDMCQWLNEHPTEFFIIHLYKAQDSNSNLDNQNLMANLMNDAAVAPHLIQFKPDLTVGEMRGKILFFKRDGLTWNSPYATVLDRWEEIDNLTSGWELRGRIYPTKPGTTNRYDRRETYLLVQDLANSYNRIDEKKAEAKKIFDFLETWHPTTRNNMVWTFNFSSAYNNSGISASTGYANNANEMNAYFLECLNNSNGAAGMVMMDFLGADEHSGFAGASGTYTTHGASLTKAIIEQNFKYIDDLVGRQATEIKFNNRSWAGTLWDNMFYGNNFFADVNSNGHMDYVIASQQQENGTVYFTTNNGEGGFNFMNERVFGTNYGTHVLVPVDINNDGNLDFLVVKGGSVEAQLSNGGGQYSKIADTGITGTTAIDENNNFEGRAVVLDANHNGIKDVVIYGNDGFPRLFLGNGDGTFTATETALPRLKNGTMAIGDYDLDGFADLLISGKAENDEALTLSIALTRDNLEFETITPESLQPHATYDGGVMFVDMNMDGLLDIFVSGLQNDWNRHDSYVSRLLINQGNDEFELADVLLDAVKKGNADWADITGNGRPDIVYAGENHLSYYTSTVLNIDDDTYKAESTMDGHRASTSVAAYDYRNSGRASVAVMGHSWDSQANQLFDAEPASQGAARSAKAPQVKPEAMLVEQHYAHPEKAGVIFSVKNASQMPAGTRYNYVMKLTDGTVISNVPVNPKTGTMLTADVNASTTATELIYPGIKKADIEAIDIQAIGADKKSDALAFSSDGITTGIDEITGDSTDAPVEYYNLQGVRIENPGHGLYIRRQGSSSTKVVL